MDLQVRIRGLAVEDLAGARRHRRVHGRGILLLLLLLLCLEEVCLGIGRGEVGLAFLQMLDLAGCVLCADEAAVETADLIAFAGRILVLKLGKCLHGGQRLSSPAPFGPVRTLRMSGLA